VSAALVLPSGAVRQLDRPAEADARVTSEDVQDAEKLARMVQELRKSVTRLERAWAPRVMVYQDVTTTGSGGSPETLRFAHQMGGRVWYSVVSSSGAAMRLDQSTATTNDVLVLTSYSAGTFSLRVEQAG